MCICPIFSRLDIESSTDYTASMMTTTAVSPRSRTVTLILAILLFFSCFGGLHRIYTGKLISGVLQLITGGGFIIWQVIDIIRILCGTYDDAQGRSVIEW